MAFLRNNPNDLFALVTNVARNRDLPEAFLEKDFWITEVLRSLSREISTEVGQAGDSVTAHVVFKGGTSLSKAYRLIERFSEDVDALLVVHGDAGRRARDRLLKRACERVTSDVGLDAELVTSGGGTHRNLRFSYPQRFSLDSFSAGVLLELGTRGGPRPIRTMKLRSEIAEYAINQIGDRSTAWEEWGLFEMDVLSPARTLVEKLSLLHSAALQAEGGDETDMERSGRHYYDVFRLLNSPDVQDELIGISGGAVSLSADVEARSAAAQFPYSPRPEGGFADSPAFVMGTPITEVASISYRRAATLIWGKIPTFEECCQMVVSHRAEL